MITQEDDHQILIAVCLQIRDEAVQRVFDGGSVVGTYPPRFSRQNRLRRFLRGGHAVEDRAVADVIPVDHSWDGLPWGMAGDERDLCHDRLSVSCNMLGLLKSQQGVLIGHGSP